MTEQDWQGSGDLDEMLRFLTRRASERKLRLFAVACCRRIWESISEQSSRQAVKIGERYADGIVTYEELNTAFSDADRAFSIPERLGGAVTTWHALDAARLAAHPEKRGLADGTATAAACAWAWGEGKIEEYWKRYACEQGHQRNLLRDIFGNPFRPITIDHSWLTPTVKVMAQQIYTDRAFDQMPILADKLEKSGCNDREILSHCHGPEPHVRGCWVVDLVLGKG